MKIKNLLTTLTLTATLLVFGQASFGQVLLEENFDYNTGQLTSYGGGADVSGGNWINFSGTSNLINVSTGSLSYEGYTSSGIGNKVNLVVGSAEDAYRQFTTQNEGTKVYVAFLLNITTTTGLLANSSTTGDYTISLLPSSSTSALVGRISIRIGSVANTFNIGIRASSSNTVANWIATDFPINTTVLVAMSYEIVSGNTNDIVNIWVNPIINGVEPAAQATQTSALTSDPTDIARVTLRQGTNSLPGQIDGIRVATTWADAVKYEADLTAPVATFTPTNGATDIAITAVPTISFNEPIRNTDNSEITDANVGSVVTLKEKVSGDPVASTITINAEKKLITITPNADLKNSMEYEISLSPVEDANDNATTLTSSTFTTISATTPTLTLTAPNEGGKFYAGDQATITWTSTNIDAAETINIEVAPNGVDYQFLATSTNDGTETVTIPVAAQYATTYKIKVSYSTASDESDVAFTVIPVVANIAAFKALAPGTVAKISGEVILSFIRTANRNQKYVQDATGGLLIDDPTPAVITTTHNLYEGITGLEGTLVMFGTYTYELVPTVNTVASTSTGNTITPAVITLAQLKADHMQYQSMLVKIEGVTIKEANGTATFVASSTASNYTMQKDAEEAVVRQAWKDGETDLIGAKIPQGSMDIIGIVGQYTASSTTTAQLQPRTLADLILAKQTVTFTVTRNSAAIEGASIAINSQTITTNASGVATIDLPYGTYSYAVSKNGYNTNNGSVSVTDAPKAVDVTMTLTSVGTNSISKLNAYPNPFSNEIRFDGAEIARVTITSIIGQVVMDKVVTGENLVETQSLSKGIYLVKFTNVKGESVLRKLIKE